MSFSAGSLTPESYRDKKRTDGSKKRPDMDALSGIDEEGGDHRASGQGGGDHGIGRYGADGQVAVRRNSSHRTGNREKSGKNWLSSF